MKFIANILSSIYNTTVNTNRWIKFIATVVLLVGAFVVGASYYSKTKVAKCEDCKPFKDQTQQLINALIDIRTGVKDMAAASTNYIMDENKFTVMYASYDTVPKKRPSQQQVKLGKMVSKLDSIILDAQRKQQIQQVKHK